MNNKNGQNRTPSDAADDRALILECCDRRPGSWERFLSQYSKLIYYSIHRTFNLKHYRSTPEEIEDLFSDTLVHFIKDDCKKLRQFRGDEGCTVATWIRTVTVRFIIDYLRQQARGKPMVSIEGDDIAMEISLANPVTRPDQALDEREEERLFSAAVAALGENDRYFIELYYTRGLSPDEVAALMKISVKTVYSRINRIKTKLQEEIDRLGRK